MRPQLTLALAILPALLTAQPEPALAPDDPRILVWYDFDGEDVEKVHKFSFIGDTPGRDRSDAVMWVDDLLLMADRPVPRPVPFVAPGRRMLYQVWARDPRFPALAAGLGAARGDLDDAEAWLARADDHLPASAGEPALSRLWEGRWSQSLVRELQQAYPGDWSAVVGTALAAEQRFYLSLWRQGPEAAAAFATRLIARLEGAGVAPARWLELQGDAQLQAGDAAAAKLSYEAALDGLPDPVPIWAKLSDVHFVLGDLAAERDYRERVRGSLRH